MNTRRKKGYVRIDNNEDQRSRVEGRGGGKRGRVDHCVSE